MTSDETPDQVNYDQGSPTVEQAIGSKPKSAQHVAAGKAVASVVARAGNGKFRSTTVQIQRDSDAARLYDQGLTYKRIAEILGMTNQGKASDAVKRHLARIPAADVESIRRQMEERLQQMRAIAASVAGREHIAHSNGRVIQIEDPENPGQYVDVKDDGPKLQAIDRLLRIEERRAKLYGVDMPSKTEFTGDVSVGVELVGVDPTDV